MEQQQKIKQDRFFVLTNNEFIVLYFLEIKVQSVRKCQMFITLYGVEELHRSFLDRKKRIFSFELKKGSKARLKSSEDASPESMSSILTFSSTACTRKSIIFFID